MIRIQGTTRGVFQNLQWKYVWQQKQAAVTMGQTRNRLDIFQPLLWTLNVLGKKHVQVVNCTIFCIDRSACVLCATPPTNMYPPDKYFSRCWCCSFSTHSAWHQQPGKNSASNRMNASSYHFFVGVVADVQNRHGGDSLRLPELSFVHEGRNQHQPGMVHSYSP